MAITPLLVVGFTLAWRSFTFLQEQALIGWELSNLFVLEVRYWIRTKSPSLTEAGSIREEGQALLTVNEKSG